MRKNEVCLAAVALALAGCTWRPDILGSLKRAQGLAIHEVVAGPGCGYEVRYNLRRTTQGFEGSALIKTSAARLTRTMDGIMIPEKAAEQFLDALQKVPLHSGHYSPKVEGPGGYPATRIVVPTPNGEVVYHTESAGQDGNPWALEVPGRQYVVRSGAPGQAIASVSSFLRLGEISATATALCEEWQRGLR